MRIINEAYINERLKKSSVFAYFYNRPEPDLTEAQRIADEFEADMRIEHEKYSQMIREAKAKGEI